MILKISKEKVTTILRPTGIDLAPYVINPYKGCQLGCLFCYAQFSKVSQKEKTPWGEYVKVKINALEILERELDELKPRKVLLGSTTECFQPVEKQFKITEQIIKLLNARRIKYVILSRSPLIKDYIPLLEKGFCQTIYFTVDVLPDKLKQKLEPRAPDVLTSIDTIKQLSQTKAKIIPYFCPVMPDFFDSQNVLSQLRGIVTEVEFEILNFNMAGMGKIMRMIQNVYPNQYFGYKKLIKEKEYYKETIEGLESTIQEKAIADFKNFKIHKHKFKEYFSNKY